MNAPLEPAHSPFGGSVAARVLRCPASVGLIEKVRERGAEYADGVFDFAAAVADPVRPDRLRGRYDSGDGLHLSPQGYQLWSTVLRPWLIAP